MPVQKFAMCLNRSDHAGHHILAPEQATRFRLEARPGTGREFTQQLAIEPGVQSKTLGNGQDDLPMCDRKADIFGNVHRGQQRPLLVTGWACTALLTGEGDEHLMVTVGAANSGKAFLQIATLEKGCHGLLDDRPPIAVLGLKAFIVDLLEGVKVFVDHAPQIRRFRITWLVERRQFGTGLSHEQHATHPTGGRASQSGQPILGSLTDTA